MIFLWLRFNRKTKLRDGISSGLDIDSESSFKSNGQKHKLMKNEDEFEEKNSKLTSSTSGSRRSKWWFQNSTTPTNLSSCIFDGHRTEGRNAL